MTTPAPPKKAAKAKKPVTVAFGFTVDAPTAARIRQLAAADRRTPSNWLKCQVEDLVGGSGTPAQLVIVDAFAE